MRHAPIVLAALLLAACTGGAGNANRSTLSSAPLNGGTLQVLEFAPDISSLDPHQSYYVGDWEVLRCCLLRTLFSYRGVTLDEGGDELRPDVASGNPVVSTDGMEWTFRLKHGLHFAPPLEDLEITSHDVVTSLEREARVATRGHYASYYSVIQGFDEYRAGDASVISGLETPDDHILRVQLNSPAGYLPYLFSLPASAPMPAAATKGHNDDSSGFLVASGPYMLDGADDVDFSVPASRQEGAIGYRPPVFDQTFGVIRPGSVTLVRNPSWLPSSDDLRPAYLDRIEITLTGVKPNAAWRSVEDGEVDLVLDLPPTPAQINDWRSDSSLSDRLQFAENDTVYFMPMNTVVPPFDDVHVRRAVMLAVDRQRLRQLAVGSTCCPDFGVVARHIAPDSVLHGLLAGYDPYPAHEGDPAQARAEMAKSAYDSNADGSCDDPVCDRVVVLAAASSAGSSVDAWNALPVLARNLNAIGLGLKAQIIGDTAGFYHVLGDPQATWGLALSPYLAWAADFPNGAGVFPANFRVDGYFNLSHVGAGASSEDDSIARVDDVIDGCLARADHQAECWASLDQQLMEQVVPWVPFLQGQDIRLVPRQIAHFSFDQWTGLPALDQIALAAENQAALEVGSS